MANRRSAAKRRPQEYNEDEGDQAATPIATAVAIEDDFLKADFRKPHASNISKVKTEVETEVVRTSQLKQWPAKLKNAVLDCLDRPVNETAGHKYLERHKWPLGLRKALIKNCRKVPLRFYIVDDSGGRVKM